MLSQEIFVFRVVSYVDIKIIPSVAEWLVELDADGEVVCSTPARRRLFFLFLISYVICIDVYNSSYGLILSNHY